jgi:hypothetical protein
MTEALPRPRFTSEEAGLAFEAWGCNCGPSALACMARLTLDEVRDYLPGFDAKRYTNPSMMREALRALARDGRIAKEFAWETTTDFGHWPPEGGLVRVQWHGPWMREGVPMQARYRHTHWVGAASRAQTIDGMAILDRGVWDVNCLENGSGSGWVSLTDWERIVVPALTEAIPKADGKWSITHVAHLRAASEAP